MLRQAATAVMVGVAQLVERQVVVLDVVGSSPIVHPNITAGQGADRRDGRPVWCAQCPILGADCPILGAAQRWARISAVRETLQPRGVQAGDNTARA